MKIQLSLLSGLLSAVALTATVSAATTATIKEPQYKLDSGGTYSSESACVAAAESSVGTHSCTAVAPIQIVVSPASAASPTVTSWGYYAGKMSWCGDYSWNVSLDYSDVSGGPESGTMDIKVVSSNYGGWQPYMACNYSWNTAGYSKVTFSLKPTKAGSNWNFYFTGVGDRPLPSGCSVNIDSSGKYGPAPVAGKWATYVVPLRDVCIGSGLAGGLTVYKFAIHDQTGWNNNAWYVDNVGYQE